jgi:hypothetical protein
MDRQPSIVRPEESGEIDVTKRDQLDKSADQAPIKIALPLRSIAGTGRAFERSPAMDSFHASRQRV